MKYNGRSIKLIHKTTFFLVCTTQLILKIPRWSSSSSTSLYYWVSDTIISEQYNLRWTFFRFQSHVFLAYIILFTLHTDLHCEPCDVKATEYDKQREDRLDGGKSLRSILKWRKKVSRQFRLRCDQNIVDSFWTVDFLSPML